MSSGACCLCHEESDDLIPVRAIDRASAGPALVEACVPCARKEAARPSSPDWLRRSIARLDAAVSPE